jgi:hypothetical protein
MVRVLRSFVLVLAALSVLTLALPARAQTAVDCQLEFDALRTAIEDATFIGQKDENGLAKDQIGLLGKVDSAQTKRAQGKVNDAVKVLNAFSLKVETLQAQGKITTGAEALITAANNAIDCVQPPEPPVA